MHIAILHGEDGAVGTGRLLPPSSRWMFDATFGFLLPSPTASYKKPDTAEGSRLAVDRRFRARRWPSGFIFPDLVYKSVYTCCNMLGFRYVLVVVSTTVLRHLCSRGRALRVGGAGGDDARRRARRGGADRLGEVRGAPGGGGVAKVVRGRQIYPRPRARAIAWDRFTTSSFLKMLPKWNFTVRSDTRRMRLISQALLPSLAHFKTSISRTERLGVPPGGGTLTSARV